MPAPRKFFCHNNTIACTISLERGLLLLSNDYVTFILKSCLARAKKLYPNLRISHFVFNGTHVHLTITVIDPQDTVKFIGYFKAETAHRFNITFGIPKNTIWCEGYDSPVILDPLRALIFFVVY